MKPHYTVNPPASARVSDMEILHAGLGVLMANMPKPGNRKNRALQISRQFRMIADHPELPDTDLRLLYRTLAAYWHFQSIESESPQCQTHSQGS